jgi:hypothetical protein
VPARLREPISPHGTCEEAATAQGLEWRQTTADLYGVKHKMVLATLALAALVLGACGDEQAAPPAGAPVPPEQWALQVCDDWSVFYSGAASVSETFTDAAAGDPARVKDAYIAAVESLAAQASTLHERGKGYGYPDVAGGAELARAITRMLEAQATGSNAFLARLRKLDANTPEKFAEDIAKIPAPANNLFAEVRQIQAKYPGAQPAITALAGNAGCTGIFAG